MKVRHSKTSKKRFSHRLIGAANFLGGSVVARAGAGLIQEMGNAPIRTVVRGNIPGLIRRGAVLAGRYSRKDVGLALGIMGLGGYTAYAGLRTMGTGLRRMATGRLVRQKGVSGHRHTFHGNQYVKLGTRSGVLTRAGRSIGRSYMASVKQKYGARGVRNVRASLKQKYGRAR